MHQPSRIALALTLALAACSSGDSGTPEPLVPSGGSGGSGGTGGGGPGGPLDSVPLEGTITASGLSAPAELVRDELGVPHIYAATLADVAFAQGYITAHDRFVQMDFFRRNASGTLSEVLGEGALATDIEPRLHHFRKNAEKMWQELKASTDPLDVDMVATLSSYAAGANLWLGELKAAKHALPGALAGVYKIDGIPDWSEVDSLAIGELQAFALSFDIDNDLLRTAAAEREKAVFFDGAANLAYAKRAGLVADVSDPRPIVPVFTVDGWAGVSTEAPASAAVQPPLRVSEPDLELARLAARARSSTGRLPAFGPGDRGSNNWVVSGALSRTNHPMVANDTHLSLINPSLFYMVHLSAGDDFEVMGVQFPGAPLVTVGFNRSIAWGVTVNQLDATDVYEEAVTPCDGGSCVTFKGAPVPLVPRPEEFRIGLGGDLSSGNKVSMTFYDVPHHGPILPRVDGQLVDPLGARELSVRYVGHDPYPIFRAILSVDRAKNVDEARLAVEKHFAYGRQNWVMADIEGNIGWTQAMRLPKRPVGTKPWQVLPGDGSAEWASLPDGKPDYVDTTKVPRSFNPTKGYLATANADPIGVTADGDPTNDATGDFPNYIGHDYDPGMRVARIDERIKQATAGDSKLDLDGMANIQADSRSLYGAIVKPHFVEAATQLAAYVAAPNADSPLKPIVDAAPQATRDFYAQARDLVQRWSLDTPSGLEPGLDSAGLDDSRATLLVATFTNRLAQLALFDEFNALKDEASGFSMPSRAAERLMPKLLDAPETLAAGQGAEPGERGEILFDDLTTPAVVETRQMILARAVSESIAWALEKVDADPAAWRWGKVHTTQPAFFAPLGLDQDAYPRHGGIGTVDVGDYTFASVDNFTFRSGSAIRFVCELDPAGPIARNVVPGGQIFDPNSPHYKDQLELWARNEAPILPFRINDVVTSAQKEQTANGFGRLRFTPASSP